MAWTFVLLVDQQEHNNDMEGYLAELNHQLGRMANTGTHHMTAERGTLPDGDYMFLARKSLSYRDFGGEEEEPVLNLSIERKTVTDIDRSIKESAKRFQGLERVEVQMRQLYANGIGRKTFLVEGDKDLAKYILKYRRQHKYEGPPCDTQDACKKRVRPFATIC
jgi:ERCC4-type nuclease